MTCTSIDIILLLYIIIYALLYGSVILQHGSINPQNMLLKDFGNNIFEKGAAISGYQR